MKISEFFAKFNIDINEPLEDDVEETSSTNEIKETNEKPNNDNLLNEINSLKDKISFYEKTIIDKDNMINKHIKQIDELKKINMKDPIEENQELTLKEIIERGEF